MKLGLLGYPITHSLSPKLYQEFLGDKLQSYELFSYPNVNEIPSIDFFSSKLNGLNITSPYKTHFLKDVLIESDLVKEIGAINIIAFTNNGPKATNTDVLAVVEILENYRKKFGDLNLILLGSGVMAKMTILVANQLGMNFIQLSRQKNPDLKDLDLTIFGDDSKQNIIINACSRAFEFAGNIGTNDIFWDYNYKFLPHQNTLPSRVKLYEDGQEMLELQAKAAIQFWNQTTSKLK